jgi:putative SOS response-associated peptidase YedK
MCGRYATTRTAADLSQIFAAMDDTDDGLAPDYNVAPTDPVPIVRMSASAHEGAGGRVLSLARWGLVPPWAEDPRVGARMINARSETVATMRAFAPSFAKRRCLVPADGWYEWTRTDTGKQAYFMTRSGMKLDHSMTRSGMKLDHSMTGTGLVFAGLWTPSRFGLTCSVLTMAAQGELARVHDRMPLLLEEDRWEEWLTAVADPGLLAPPAESYVAGIEIRPVGAGVGNVRNDSPELIERVPETATQQALF